MNPLNSPKVFEIAHSLGLARSLSPSEAVLHYCEQRIGGFLDLFPDCATPQDLLEITKGMLKAKFERIDSDEDLDSLVRTYCDRRELAFANLANELCPTTYGISIRLQRAAPYQPQFICVIDCRGEKRLRSYFTKWHELGHLLILTDEQQHTFHRSHTAYGEKEPEEVLVDILAGHFGFFPAFLTPELTQPLSFATINRIRARLFKEASLIASATACVKSHQHPYLLVEAKVALSERQKTALHQGTFDFFHGPDPKLRAVTVVSNDAARRSKFNIPKTFRVPERSAIFRVHSGESGWLSATEELDWWESSDSRRLPRTPIRVEARGGFNATLALLSPNYGDGQD